MSQQEMTPGEEQGRIRYPASAFSEATQTALSDAGLDLSPGQVPEQTRRQEPALADLTERRHNPADLDGKIAIIGALTRELTEVISRTGGRPAIGYKTQDGTWSVFAEQESMLGSDVSEDKGRFVELPKDANSLHIAETVAAVRLSKSALGAFPVRAALGSSFIEDPEVSKDEVFEPVSSSVKAIVDRDVQVVGRYANVPILPSLEEQERSVTEPENLV